MQTTQQDPFTPEADPVNLEQILDYVENFEAKGIQIVFLSTPSRGGVTLLHSLLDGHPQILQIPVVFPFMSGPQPDMSLPTPEQMVELFFKAMNPNRGRLGGCGRRRLLVPVEKVTQVMLQVLPRLSRLDRGTFMLAFYFCYAAVQQLDFRQFKLILSHEHGVPGFNRQVHMTTPPDWNHPQYFTSHHTHSLGQYACEGDPYLEEILKPFPNAKIIMPIRSPMATFYGKIWAVTYHTGPDCERPQPYDLRFAYHMLYEPLVNYYWAYAMKRYKPDRVYFIKYEDIHGNVVQTMQKLAADFGIAYQESMTRTTFGGMLWKGIEVTSFGYEPTPDTSPERLERDNAWKTALDPDQMQQCYTLCKPLYDMFDYDPVYGQPLIPVEMDWASLEKMLPIEQQIYDRYPETLRNQYLQALEAGSESLYPALSEAFESFQAQWQSKQGEAIHDFHSGMGFWADYPRMRMEVLHYLKQAQSDLAGTSVRDCPPWEPIR